MSTLLTKLTADFSTQLASALSVGGTSATLLSQTDDDGNTIPDGNYSFTLDGASSNKEHIRCVKTGLNLTSIQSLSRQGALTTGVVRAHRIGTSVVITDWAQLKYLTDLLTGDTDLDASNPLKYDGTATLSNDADLATKKYVDDTAIAGSPKATDSVYGITKLSVAAVSGTDPIAVGTNDTRMPTQDENNALVGTSGSPSTSNKYVTNDDTAENTASKVIRRKSDSNVTVPTTPTATTDATSKAYVDAAVPVGVIQTLTTSSQDSGTSTIFSYTVPILKANSYVEIELPFVLNANFNATGGSITMTGKYASSTVGTSVITKISQAGTDTGSGSVKFVFKNNGATNSQICSGMVSNPAVPVTTGNGYIITASTFTAGGTLTVDSTSTQTFTVESVFSASVGTVTFSKPFIKVIQQS